MVCLASFAVSPGQEQFLHAVSYQKEMCVEY